MPYTMIQTLLDPAAQGDSGGTERKTSLRNCPTPRSTRISRRPRRFRASFPECTSTLWTAQRTGRRRTRQPGGAATPPGSMVIYGVDPDPAMGPNLKDWAEAYWKAVHSFNLEERIPKFHHGRRGRGSG